MTLCAKTVQRQPGFLSRQLRLYLVTDTAALQGRDLVAGVLAAVHGGVTCVQLRDKHASTRDLLTQAQALLAALRPLSIPLVVNDRVDVALAAGADGVHLGQSDMPPLHARRLLPPHMFIGWSVETPADLAQAAVEPVDYLGISPVWSTPTKTDTAPAWGLDGVALVRRQSRLPLVGIGGIHAGNAAAVCRAGAHGVAVVRAILADPDPQAAARRLRAEVDGACGSCLESGKLE